ALSATLLGHVAHETALSRNGARAGDSLWVTGNIGDAALGLLARLGKCADPSGYLTKRSLLPEPRLGLALAGVVSAAIDVSDGLVQDLGHMCRGAGLSAVLRAGLVPASAQAAALGGQMLETRLTGGDDYELLLAVPPGHGEALKAACGALKVTKIGVFQAGEGVHVLDESGEMMKLSATGWNHF
ncbi:MAG: thiamine-phosphate kinase, partial [Acidocella sp. 20-61-6]